MKVRIITTTVFLILQLSGFFVCCSGADAIKPVNREASAEARKVLDYLKSVQGKQMLAGHHVMF